MIKPLNISSSTKIYGIIGYPVEHSLSPDMQNAAIAYHNLDLLYVAFSVLPQLLPDALSGLKALGISGVNVTIPHKEAVVKYLSAFTPEAELIGAVNTIRVENNKLVGHNTDGIGFMRSLKEETGFIPIGKKVLILGAGGVARAVLLTLAGFGPSQICIANRTRQRALDLAVDIQKKTGVSTLGIGLEEQELAVRVREADLLIQATSAGMYPQSELPGWFNFEWLCSDTLVCDLIYRPRPTEFLKAAAARGCRTQDGLGMLLYQGAEAFTWWTGLEAPVEVMRQALLDKLES